MVKSESETVSAYREGVNEFGGAQAYKDCAGKSNSGFLAVSKCLQDKKSDALSTDSMVSRYRNSA